MALLSPHDTAVAGPFLLEYRSHCAQLARQTIQQTVEQLSILNGKLGDRSRIISPDIRKHGDPSAVTKGRQANPANTSIRLETDPFDEP